MALIKCRECSREISSKATSCPGCGVQLRAPKRKTSMFTWLVLVFIVFGVVSSIVAQRNKESEDKQKLAVEQARVASLSPEQHAAELKAKVEADAIKEKAEKLNSARFTCEEFVKRSLNDPKSAEFESHHTYYAEERAGGLYLVQVRLRARNAFNALVPAVFDCQTKLTNGSWIAVKISQV